MQGLAGAAAVAAVAILAVAFARQPPGSQPASPPAGSPAESATPGSPGSSGAGGAVARLPSPSPDSSGPVSPIPEPSAGNGAGGPGIVAGAVGRTSIDLEARYDADVGLAFDDRRLRVAVAIEITNRSGSGIDRVELNTIAAPLGRMRLGPVLVDGRPAVAAVRDQTIVVPLGGVLPDGSSTRLDVAYRARVPTGLSGSSWMFTRTNGILQASRWLPWVGLRHPFSRPNHGDPFFTASSPFVRVRITSDRRLVIATPGRRVAVYGLSQTFEAENVRDFHIVASPDFSVRERAAGDWTIRAFVRDGFPASRVMDQAADALERMSRLAGDYPYRTFSIAETAGGYALEGPGMIWIPTGLSGSRLRWNVYHETAHQWLYGIVGSDGALDPFADEAVATHLGQVASGIWRTTTCPMRRLDLSIYRYGRACYFGQVYLHGAELLEQVRRAMADGEYWRAMRAYVGEHRYGIGSTRELLEALQAHTSRDLRPLLRRWFPSLF